RPEPVRDQEHRARHSAAGCGVGGDAVRRADDSRSDRDVLRSRHLDLVLRFHHGPGALARGIAAWLKNRLDRSKMTRCALSTIAFALWCITRDTDVVGCGPRVEECP